ncbi:B12 binding protein [Actinophytocola oryzae]|uniref:B12 binding protein n=1 Tax=Actinophytocola oryzae TaxID=502181 RepID=A0A4R7W0S1_9PSEU|nr:B12 binding protein [Actinophytocola oryzae]
MYTAGQVARALGVAETTLRSWHRRYRIGPHAATPGGYRRYSAEDVTRLQDMCDLIRSGMLASDAARTVSGKPSAESLRLLRDRLTAAGRRLDSRACLEIVAEAVRTLGVPATWDGLCCPVLREVESEQAARADDTACIPREHVLSWAITAALHQVTPTIPVGNLPTVMLACTDTEQHSLPLEALAAALAERRVPVRMLGAAVPTASLVDAVRAASPHVVVLWAQRRETASRQTLARLRRLPVRPLTAGPGWLPRRHGGVGHVDSLSAALASLADIIEGAEPVGSPGRP